MFTGNLRSERDRQLTLHLERYFHEALGLEKDKYVEHFPQIHPQSSESEGAVIYDFPLIVTAIEHLPLGILTSLMGGVNNISEEVSQWGRKPPRAPYVTWTNGGKTHLNMSVEKVRESLTGNRRGASLAEGILQTIIHPETVKNTAIELPGTALGIKNNYNATIHWLSDQPALFSYWIGNVYPYHGALICTEQIEVK